MKREFTFETIRHDSRGSEHEIKVTYTATPGRPAVLWGDCPQPEEPPECEIVRVCCGGEELNLYDAEYQALLELCHERAADDFLADACDAKDRRAEEMRERRLLGEEL